jgi:hypothetical protein
VFLFISLHQFVHHRFVHLRRRTPLFPFFWHDSSAILQPYIRGPWGEGEAVVMTLYPYPGDRGCDVSLSHRAFPLFKIFLHRFWKIHSLFI